MDVTETRPKELLLALRVLRLAAEMLRALGIPMSQARAMLADVWPSR